MGDLEEVKGGEQLKERETFYNELGKYAKNLGVIVNIVAIKGEEANIDCLSKVCERTGGDVKRVEALELAQSFSDILSIKTIATKVMVQALLHKSLEFRNQDP